MKTTKPFLSQDEKERIVQAIVKAEAQTSGEIRVHIDENPKGDPLDRAAYFFEKLGMHRTEARNGVLVYLAPGVRRFAILGDAGINSLVPEGFWDKIKREMTEAFAAGKFSEGLERGILSIGESLKLHFPHAMDDENELSNEINFS